MPVKAELRQFYPWNWPSIAREVKRRAFGVCEQCGAPEGALVRRRILDPGEYVFADEVAVQDELLFRPAVRVVLAAAHRDGRLVDHSFENLRALCQRCHINEDRPRRGVVEPRPLAFVSPP